MFTLDGRARIGSYNDLALASALKAYALAPDDPWSLLVLGASYSRQRREDLAEEKLREALRLDPNLSLAHAWLAYAYANGQHPEKAEAELQAAFRLSPRDVYLTSIELNIRCQAALAMGDFEKVLDFSRRGLERNPDYIAAWRMHTAALASFGRQEEARKSLQELLKRQPGLGLTVASVGRATAIAAKTARDRFLDALRLAGLPEG